ncbi:MAG: AAA family ATPase [Clostridiales bacterium]|nr:AAA family ATPase [Clostridiales bacterium]
MKLIIITGACAVGKMTVGQELVKIIDLKLFYNHLTIEPIIEVFGYPDFNLIKKIRMEIFKTFAKSNLYGMIFTCCIDFDSKEDLDYTAEIINIFSNTDVYFVELVAPQEVRLQRNATQNRLNMKPSKRNLELSDKWLLNDDLNCRFESRDGEVKFENYIKINNADISAQQVAGIIKEKFDL